jgi:hypothetical protein
MAKSDALYYSAVTLGTLGYGDYVPLTHLTRQLVLWQLITAVLFLLGAFPLLVSRLAAFEDRAQGSTSPPN